MKFRKKPVEIDAVQWTGENREDVVDFVLHSTNGKVVTDEEKADALLIYTLEGIMIADSGDWIIRGIKGECYPCKPDIFQETYEEVT